MQCLIAFALLLAIAANEWPSPFVGVTDTHRVWAVVLVQTLLSALAGCGCDRLGPGPSNPIRTWFPILCWLAGSLIVTLGLGWSQWVANHYGMIDVGSAVLILVPHLASLVVVWAVPLALGEGRSKSGTRPSMTDRWRVIGSHLRVRFQWQLLPILLPLLTVLIARDLLERSVLWQQLNWTMQVGVLAGASMLIVLLGFPYLIKCWLPTKPFADPDFQRCVDDAGARLGLNLRESVEWQTQMKIANALVLGWLPGTRRILISDVLCWALTPRQRFAVFLHEAGHLKRHHLWWRLSVIVLAAEVLLLGSIASQPELNWANPQESFRVFLATLGLLGLMLLTALLMGLVSRALEFEADAFVLEYDRGTPSSELEPKSLSLNLPDDLIAAIRCTADLTGTPLTHVTWMHPSIAERIERLRFCHASPILRKLVQRRLRVLKGMLLGSILLLASLLALHGLVWTI